MKVISSNRRQLYVKMTFCTTELSVTITFFSQYDTLFKAEFGNQGLHPKWGSIAIKPIPFVRLQSWLPMKPNHLSTLIVLIVYEKPRLPSTVWREIERGWVRQVRSSLKWNASRWNRTKTKSRHISTALSLFDSQWQSIQSWFQIKIVLMANGMSCKFVYFALATQD